MKPFKSHVLSAAESSKKWSPQDDFALLMMWGNHPLEQIALRLGRTPWAVEAHVKARGWGLSKQIRAAKAQARAELALFKKQLLSEDPESLQEFCAVPDEDPVLPHTADREYHRKYYQDHNRAQQRAEHRARVRNNG